MFKRSIITLVFFLSVGVVQAQTLEETLGALSADAAKAYVSPIVSGFGANLNSGWVHRAPKAKFLGFDLEFGIVAMGTLFGDDNKTFSSSGVFKFSKAQAEAIAKKNSVLASNPIALNEVVTQIMAQEFNVGITGPTVIGAATDSIKLAFAAKTFTTSIGSQTVPGQDITLPVTGYLEDLSALPLAAPQLTFGTVYGTQVSLRYLPDVEINKDLGKFKYSGFGIQHNPGVWFPNPLPLEVAVGFFTQTMEVGTIFKSSASTFGVFASRQFGPGALNITPYAGFWMESSKIEVAYDFILEDTPVPGSKQTIPVSFEVEGENTTRFTVGASIKLAIINLSVDYSLAKYNTVSGGLSFYF